MSTGLEMPVEPHELPISIDNLWVKIQKTENFKYFEKDIHKFMTQVFPMKVSRSMFGDGCLSVYRVRIVIRSLMYGLVVVVMVSLYLLI